MVEVIFYILIVNGLLRFKLWWDWRAKNIKKRVINHSLSAAIDTFIYLVSSWYLFGWDAGGWLILALGYRWLMFDIFFNLSNKDEWWHYGDSSKLDKFLVAMGNFHLVPKIALIILGITIIILTT